MKKLTFQFATLLALALTAAAASARPNILWFIVDDMSANFSCYGEKTHPDTATWIVSQSEGTRFSERFHLRHRCALPAARHSSRGCTRPPSARTTIAVAAARTEDPTARPASHPFPLLFQQGGLLHLHRQRHSRAKDEKARKPRLQPEAKDGGDDGEGKGAGFGKTDYNFEWDCQACMTRPTGPGREAGTAVLHAGAALRRQAARRRFEESSGSSCSNAPRTSLGGATKPERRHPSSLLSARPGAAARLGGLSRCRALHRQARGRRARAPGEARVMLEQTLVIFMTDHGISHARGKQFLYNEGTHIPFVVRGPGIAEGPRCATISSSTSTSRRSRSPPPVCRCRPVMQGRNVFAAGLPAPREAVFAARDRCDETVERIRSVRTDRFLYIRNLLSAAAALAAERLQGRQVHRANAPRAA